MLKPHCPCAPTADLRRDRENLLTSSNIFHLRSSHATLLTIPTIYHKLLTFLLLVSNSNTTCPQGTLGKCQGSRQYCYRFQFRNLTTLPLMRRCLIKPYICSCTGREVAYWVSCYTWIHDVRQKQYKHHNNHQHSHQYDEAHLEPS